MANMDFGSLCPVERTDEIGVLSDSLNTLSSNLSAALTELKDANQKLQADIDKERELELQRIKFFSAASHELKNANHNYQRPVARNALRSRTLQGQRNLFGTIIGSDKFVRKKWCRSYSLFRELKPRNIHASKHISILLNSCVSG